MLLFLINFLLIANFKHAFKINPRFDLETTDIINDHYLNITWGYSSNLTVDEIHLKFLNKPSYLTDYEYSQLLIADASTKVFTYAHLQNILIVYSNSEEDVLENRSVVFSLQTRK